MNTTLFLDCGVFGEQAIHCEYDIDEVCSANEDSSDEVKATLTRFEWGLEDLILVIEPDQLPAIEEQLAEKYLQSIQTSYERKYG